MIIQSYNKLDKNKKQEVSALLAFCNKNDDCKNAYAYKEENDIYTDFDCHYLVYNNTFRGQTNKKNGPMLVAGFVVLFVSENMCEISGVIHPDYRDNEEILTVPSLISDELYDMFDDLEISDYTIEYVANPKPDYYKKSMELSEFELGKSTLLMKLDLTSSEINNKINEYANKTSDHLEIEEVKAHSSIEFEVYDQVACIYNVFVEETYRQKGYGRALVIDTIKNITANHTNIKQIILNVDKENQAAVRLYQSLGFITTEQLDYYI